jgi:hypothetical protein
MRDDNDDNDYRQGAWEARLERNANRMAATLATSELLNATKTPGRERAMTSRDFCFWLQGFFELSNEQALSTAQTSMIAKHLALVFRHEIDPSMGGPTGWNAVPLLES